MKEKKELERKLKKINREIEKCRKFQEQCQVGTAHSTDSFWQSDQWDYWEEQRRRVAIRLAEIESKGL